MTDIVESDELNIRDRDDAEVTLSIDVSSPRFGVDSDWVLSYSSFREPVSLTDSIVSAGAGSEDASAPTAATSLADGAALALPAAVTLAGPYAMSLTPEISGPAGEDIHFVDNRDHGDIDAIAHGGEAFSFVGAGAFAATVEDLRHDSVGDGKHGFGDISGDSLADFALVLDNHIPLGPAEIIL